MPARGRIWVRTRVKRRGAEHAIQIWVDADACPAVIKEILSTSERHREEGDGHQDRGQLHESRELRHGMILEHP